MQCSAPLRAEEALHAALRPGHEMYQAIVISSTSAGLDDLNLQSEAACSFRYLSQSGLSAHRIGRIDQHGNSNGIG
jgi:hypothetical protein